MAPAMRRPVDFAATVNLAGNMLDRAPGVEGGTDWVVKFVEHTQRSRSVRAQSCRRQCNALERSLCVYV